MRGFAVSSFDYKPFGRGGAVGWFRGFDVLGRRYGFDKSTVFVNGDRYLDRWIVYLAGYTCRVHRFWRGDDARASHTHPWWFVTFPLGHYAEDTYRGGVWQQLREVRAWRPHYRPADFEHIVLCGLDREGRNYNSHSRRWWTLVVTGRKQDTWGLSSIRTFVHHKDWK